jgi:hypothetical protein
MDELMTEQLEKWMDEDWGVTHKEYNPALVPDKYKRKINEYYGLSIINKIM